MPDAFERTSLWRRTLGASSGDGDDTPRQALRWAYLKFRETVAPLAAEIALSLPMFTDHSIAHIDALWDTASLICGDDFPINPAEAFVLGGAFLLHDVGMGLAAYGGDPSTLENDPSYGDLLASAVIRLRRADPSASAQAIDAAAREETIAELLRLRHAAKAESLVTTAFQSSDGEPFYLLPDTALRQTFGSLIGRIAHSHWLDVDALGDFKQFQGSCVTHPSTWKVDPLKVACILRLADAAQIDNRRAPTYLHAFRRPTAASRDHWYFQERLTRPLLNADRLEYTATQPFRRKEASAWWLAWETIQSINDELRQVDALCADFGRPRFRARSVAGADSPERLALFIRTEGWDPVDARLRVTGATDLIANLGGVDLYGQRPEIAVRELIANAADATLARAAHEKRTAGAVTIRLSEEKGSWWVSVEDHGIGMRPDTMVSALTDFGFSRWQSPYMISEFPNILSSGFQPTGRFGIGFFAVFMAADEIDVISLGYDEGARSTRVLEFRNGVAGRPLLREADAHERRHDSGTMVRAKLRHDPRTLDGIFKTDDRGLTHTQLLHSKLTRMCALAPVDIAVQGPDDPSPVRIIDGNDWTTIPPAELFRRLYRREEASHLDRVIYDGYEKYFVDRATYLHDVNGEICGRAMMASGLERMPEGLRWMKATKGVVYVGGFEADEILYSMGAFSGVPLTADRLRAWPKADVAEFISWVGAQARVISESPLSTGFDLYQMGYWARGLGAQAPQLPCALSSEGQLNQQTLIEWIKKNDELYLIPTGMLDWFDRSNKGPVFYTFEGEEVDPPSNVLFVSMNPNWFFPEQVLPRPRDERFSYATKSSATWNLDAWWYDTGNFGSIGLVVRTIADEWSMTIEQIIRTMEPLHLQGDHDFRHQLAMVNGEPVKVTAIRVRKPSG